jgi:hypothetical protein
MKGILILILILGIVGLIVNTISYFTNYKTSFLRVLIIWGGIKKRYGKQIVEKNLTIKPHDVTYDWVQTEFGDFKIELDLVDKPNRESYRYRLVVNKNGELIDDNTRDNDKFLIKLGLKEEPTRPTPNQRWY